MYLKLTIFYIKIVFCVILHLVTSALQDKALRIIGGRDATPGEFPYVAKMKAKIEQKDGVSHVHICTCTLLKPTWSLTAAHCIKGFLKLLSKAPSTKGIIKYNISSDHESPYSYILSMFQHPNFKVPNLNNDIGLLLSERIALTTFGKLSPVDYLTLYGSKVLVLGYGMTTGAIGTYGDAYSVNKPLQVLDVIITKCFQIGLYPSFCLGGLCGQTSSMCPGDSGGTVLHNSGVIGVNTATYFNICKARDNPTIKFKNFAGVITPASPYTDWVTNVIKSNSL